MKKPASFYFFKRKPIVLKDRYERWRGVADLLGFTARERLRGEWMVFYYTRERECRPHCPTLRHLKKDILQMVQTLQGLKLRCP
jgi:hypothetical protein